VGFRVLIDGGGPGPGPHGLDVDEDGNGTVSDSRLYQLVRQPRKTSQTGPSRSRFLDSGVQAYVFTFG